MPSCRAYTIPNNPKCVSLSDLLHEVPRLWDFMPSRNVLFGVNQELRRQAQGLVTCIRIDGLLTEQVHHLTKGGWSQLRCLALTNSFFPFSSAARLNKKKRPMFNVTNASNYTYDTLFDPRENVFPQFQGKWPLLESLTVTLYRMDIAQVTALAEIDWPRLQTLCIELEDNAIPALMMGNWPQLKDLSIGKGLGNTAFVQLTMKYAAEIAAHHWPSQSKWHVQSYPSASPPTSGALFCGCSLVHRWRGPGQ